MKSKFLICTLLSLICIAYGCSDIEELAQVTINNESLEYFESQMVFPSEGETQTIKFSTNKNWEIKVSESGMNVNWCSVTPAVGQPGEATVSIKTLKNTSYDERNVVLTLTAGDIVKKLRVSQKQNNAILLSSSLYEIPTEGGEIELHVRSNVNYSVEIPEQYRNWIHSGSSTRGLVSKDLRFHIDANEDYEKREGEIIISNGNLGEIVKIYQSGGGILVLSQNEYFVPSGGGSSLLI